MHRQRRTNIALGIVLILVGAWFLARLFFPGLREWYDMTFSWPMTVIGVGAFLFLLGLLLGTPGMAVPAAIVGGIGGILYYQNATDDWQSWSYMWALIPGFVGVGSILAGVLGENPRHNIRSGFSAIIVSAVLFLVFASLFGEIDFLGPYWPVLLILLGLWVLVRNLLRKA